MLKISRIEWIRMRNDAHFQLHTEISDLTAAQDLDGMRVKAQFDAYKAAYNKVDEGLKQINKSSYTAEIQDADKARDETFLGMVDICRACLRHFDPEAKRAAQRLKILFDTYGNISKKPLYEQTSAMNNIIQDLTGKYADDAKAIGIDVWAAEMDSRNKAFDALVKGRFDEKATRTDVVLKTARVELDEAFRILRDRVEALVIVEGPELYEDYIKRLNIIITKYARQLAAAAGRRKATRAAGAGEVDGADDGDAAESETETAESWSTEE